MQNEEKIHKWLNGELSSEELDDLKQTEEYKSLSPILEKTSYFKKPGLDKDKALRAFHQFRAAKDNKVVKLTPWRKIAAVAASIAILVISYFTFFNNTQKFTTDLAETTSINLPDQSEVIINSESVVSYQKNWEKRKVKLQGEAYFKVTKGKKFDVETKQGTISVLGTQFNVLERDGIFKVTCFEGKVSVDYKGQQFLLTAGKSIAVIEGKLNEIDGLTEATPDWTRGESNFDDVPLKLVIEELERQYNVSVKYDKSLSKINFKGGFTYNNLETAIESITFPLNLEYKIVNAKNIELSKKK